MIKKENKKFSGEHFEANKCLKNMFYPHQNIQRKLKWFHNKISFHDFDCVHPTYKYPALSTFVKGMWLLSLRFTAEKESDLVNSP